jgi:hypothetical protein
MYIVLYNKSIIINKPSKNHVAMVKILYNNKQYFFDSTKIQYSILWNLYNAYYNIFYIKEYNSIIEISKNDKYKYIKYIDDLYIQDRYIFYAYFIYNKYYTYTISMKYYSNFSSIYYTKLFNSRDYYRIFSYIYRSI